MYFSSSLCSLKICSVDTLQSLAVSECVRYATLNEASIKEA